MQKADPLIRTKLRLPFTRPGLVSRPRLQQQFAQGLGGPLTLVIAPAGFGKTTLATACVANCGLPVAWLSLDKHDNQAERFLRYLIAALQETGKPIESEAVQLAALQQAPPEAVLTHLINDLDRAGTDIVLVLDDYQLISSQAVHDAVAFLLEHRPQSLHLVIATRSDPPLPLARLRAHGQLVELRAAELRFTKGEAAQFLNDVMGLHLDAGSVALLAERTEGWIAGLQMAALSMRDRKDPKNAGEFIKGFSGTNRYILDYLLEEVLAGQSPEIQYFLLCTAILERLAAPLCAAVLANDVGAKSAAILEHLERANLFLAPLDDARVWYRYHHLFADLLRARLDQLHPGLSPRLHARAAAWLESAGETVEAVNHTLAAGDYDGAARLVEENTTRLLAQGELNALMGWIETLPATLRLARPWLCVHQAYALMLAGRPAEVEPLLAQVKAALAAADVQDTATLASQADKTEALAPGMAAAQALRGAVAAVRTFTAVVMGQDAEVLAQAQQARALLPAGALFDRSLVAWAVGNTMLTQGRLHEARLAFEEQVRLGRALSNSWTLLAGQTFLAMVLQAQGRLPQARALLEAVLAEAGQQGARSRGYIARAENSLVSVLYEQNALEAASCMVAEAIALTRQWPNPNHLVYAYALQARVLLAQGDLPGARVAIGAADQIRRSALLTRWLRRTVEAAQVRVWLALQAAGAGLDPGDPLAKQAGALVAAWRSELASLAGSDDAVVDACAESAALTVARIDLAAGQAAEALALLERVACSARAAGHVDALIGALVLSAVAGQSQCLGQARSSGQAVPAFTELEAALDLAEAGGYVRVFLDEGQPMQLLLARWLAHAGAGRLRDYACHLLAQFDAEQHPAAQAKIPPTGGLVEPISQRELEVLQLMALGRTNQAIAQQLVVARGTIKAHAASLYRKLDVANRSEAVARARQLGILP